MLPLLRCFFAHLLILQYPDHHQNLISSYLYYSGPVHKISSQSVHNFLSNVVHRQTNRQTNATKNITSFAKEVTRSTQRAQTSLAEADHCSNMPTVKILSLGGERLILPPPPPPLPNKRSFWIITCTMIWLCYCYYSVFCSFTHLRILRSASNFNQFFIVLPRTPP